MTNLAPDALGPTITVGEILVEIVATSEGEGFLEPLPLLGPFPSGAPAIFIDQCARIGGSAAMVGAVGDDDFGRLNIRRLQRDGVDVSAVTTSSDYPTGSAFVRYRPDGARDFVFNIARSAAALIEWTPQVETLVNRAGHLHVMGTVFAMPSAWEITRRAADIVKSRGGSLSLDPNLRKELMGHVQTRERLNQLVEMSDLILPSGDELALAAGISEEPAAVRSLFQRGVREIVVKRGDAGSTYYDMNGLRIDCPAFLVDELDPTGAGDCFGGAYVGCRRLGLEPPQALNYANAAGARNATVRGPMEGAATRAELDDFMARTARNNL
jgi:tagatose kinase